MVPAPFNDAQTLKFKTQLMIAFFAAFNHNYDNQWTLKKRNKQYGSKSTNHSPWT